MVIARFRVGKQMRRGEFRDNACGAHGHAAGELEENFAKMANRPHLQLCRTHRSSSNLCIIWKFTHLVALLVVVMVFLGAEVNAKGFQRNLDSFFCKVDQDGNGEIEQGEASKVIYLFLLCKFCFILGACIGPVQIVVLLGSRL